MAVMDSDNIVVGSKSPSPRPASALPEKPSPGTEICGAMSQQCDHLSNQSAPQKFVHLVGYRDSKARPATKQ
jgi:hypothetical protein